jgi:hypothetical protein
MNETTNPAVPSLEVNLGDIEAIAAGLDAQADEAVTIGKRTPKKRTVRLKQPPATQEGDAQQPAADAPAPLDPEFEAMIVHGASQGIDLMRDKLELMEPGDTLRQNVGKCLAKLVTRLKPMKEGPLSDVVTIAGYLGTWALCGRDWSAKKPQVIVVPPSPNN